MYKDRRRQFPFPGHREAGAGGVPKHLTEETSPSSPYLIIIKNQSGFSSSRFSSSYSSISYSFWYPLLSSSISSMSSSRNCSDESSSSRSAISSNLASRSGSVQKRPFLN